MESVLTFHQTWFYVAVATNGLVGLWGLGLAIAKREPGRRFYQARAVAIVAMLVQIVAGVTMYLSDNRPANPRHLFYAAVIGATLAFAYVYRASMARKPALAYGLLLLFTMGLGFRAWANVF